MNEYGDFIHFGTVALTAAINAVGVGIGQGLTSHAALEGINRQPAARNEITRTAILGLALTETAAVMGTFISLFLLVQVRHNNYSLYGSIAELGIAFAICCSGFVL